MSEVSSLTHPLPSSSNVKVINHYFYFSRITSDSLNHTMAAYGLAVPVLRTELLEAYHSLKSYPEVPQVLDMLKKHWRPSVIRSNPNPEKLEDAVRNSRLINRFHTIVYADAINYKPDLRVYELATSHFQCNPGAILFC